jgi:hypothetical protein
MLCVLIAPLFEILLFYLKAQEDERGGRILLGDATNGGAIMLRPIGFRCVGVSVQTGLCLI